jgi:hypothetical protein
MAEVSAAEDALARMVEASAAPEVAESASSKLVQLFLSYFLYDDEQSEQSVQRT